MKKILVLLMISFPIVVFCGPRSDEGKLEMSFKQWQAFSHQAYSDNALGVWDCAPLGKSDVNAVLSFKDNTFIFYHSLNKFVFSLSSAGANKLVTLFSSGLKALNPIGNTKLADELEFDYETDILSFKSSTSSYGNFVNYQCVKRT